MDRQIFIGIDVGSASVRGGVFDASGRRSAFAARAVQHFHPRALHVEQWAAGESTILTQGLCHHFYGEGRVPVGEVSQVNHDHLDNRFYEAVGRFSSIIEDEVSWRLMVSDYAAMAAQ